MSAHALMTLDAVGGTNATLQLLQYSPAADGGVPGVSARVVHIGSLDGAPFSAVLAWTTGGGDAAQARLSVAAGTRVCINARTITLTCANLHNAANRVFASVNDGFIPTSNTYEVWYGSPPAGASLNIPSWAYAVELQAASGATGALVFKTSTGLTLGVVALGSIPAGGALIGAASTIEVTCSSACRVLYRLTL